LSVTLLDQYFPKNAKEQMLGIVTLPVQVMHIPVNRLFVWHDYSGSSTSHVGESHDHHSQAGE
jgi:hypothetical protein